MIDLGVIVDFFLGVPGDATDGIQPLGRMHKATINYIIWEILILLEGDRFFLIVSEGQLCLQHLVVQCENVES